MDKELPFDEPTDEQIASIIAAFPDIRPKFIRQADEHVEYLTALAKTWIINGDEYHGTMLQVLCLAFGFQQTEIERLRVEGANQRALLRGSDAQALPDGERITDDNGDELEHGADDAPDPTIMDHSEPRRVRLADREPDYLL